MMIAVWLLALKERQQILGFLCPSLFLSDIYDRDRELKSVCVCDDDGHSRSRDYNKIRDSERDMATLASSEIQLSACETIFTILLSFLLFFFGRDHFNFFRQVNKTSCLK